MRNLFHLLLAVVVAFITVSCGPSQKEIELQEMADEKAYTTSDLTMYDLHGHVKSIESTFEEIDGPICGHTLPYIMPKSAQFNESGHLAILEYYYGQKIGFSQDGKKMTWYDEGNHDGSYINHNNYTYEVIRDSDNDRLKRWKPDIRYAETDGYYFSYNDKGKLTSVKFEGEMGGNPNFSAVYNETGNVEKLTMTGYVVDKYSFTYLEYDNHGNWTKRKVRYFYEATYSDEEDIDKTITETRKITYYSNPIKEQDSN